MLKVNIVQKFKDMKLLARLRLLLSILVCMIAIVFGVTLYYLGESHIFQESKKQYEHFGKLASNFIVKNIEINDPAQVNLLLRSLKEFSPDVQDIAVVSRDGKIVWGFKEKGFLEKEKIQDDLYYLNAYVGQGGVRQNYKYKVWEGIYPIRGVSEKSDKALYFAADFSSIDKLKSNFMFHAFLTFVITLALGIIMAGLFLRRTVTDRMSVIVTALARVGEGDLTQVLPEDSEDEIGLIARSVNWTRQCFQMTVHTLRETAQKVNAMSQEVSEILENQVTASTGQSTAVVESTTSLEELSRSAQQNTESAEKVVAVAEETLLTGQIGTEAINNSADRIHQISEQNRVNLEKLSSLRKQFTKIAEVASFITEMAYQTRLIAFNATLKAAEGGEAGKTFGVIAREIRSLADNVAGYAREIHTHIAEIRDSTNDLTIAAENTTRRIDEGQISNQEAQQAFAKIVAEVQKTTEAAHYISQSSLQQQEAIEQFLTVFREIAQGARSLADGSQQARDSVIRLVEFAGSGTQVVSNFKLE